MAEIIAERTLICVKPSGDRIPVTFRIGRPYRASDVDWACPVAAEGLHSKLSDIHGGDSFQALILTQKLLCQLMIGVIDDGGCFRSADDDSPIDVRQMFSSGI
jgi:hypothetical protein